LEEAKPLRKTGKCPAMIDQKLELFFLVISKQIVGSERYFDDVMEWFELIQLRQLKNGARKSGVVCN
jgi:hypothetical protein